MTPTDYTLYRKSMRASAIAWIQVARRTQDREALELARKDLRLAQYWRKRSQKVQS